VEEEEQVRMEHSLVIGIDLGATTVKAGIVNQQGTIQDRLKADALAMKGPSAVIRQIVSTVRALQSKAKNEAIRGVGIGAPGVVGLEGGVVKYPPNFADWAEVDLGAVLHREFGLPVEVENDANVAALAEAKFGAGRGQRDFLFVIWGTGVGGGIILGGEIYRGPSGGAGEIGHVTIDHNGPECGCGNRGCVEAYVGQRYLSQRTREKLAATKQPSKIVDLVKGNLDVIEPSLISSAARQGDLLAHDILVEAGELLGIGLASALNILDLRLVVIGGGLSGADRFVFEAVERSIKSRVLKGSKNAIRVVPAQLGNDAGILGAASLVWARSGPPQQS
jgi:glucokinase